jgi:predicted nucleic acid-binding protein
MALYLDASALVKLVVAEEGTWALAERVRGRPTATSVLSRVEVERALRRAELTGPTIELAGAVLRRVVHVGLDGTILARAARLEPTALRTLDAIHLATALSFEPDVEAFVTYDRRLADAAERAGLPVESPVEVNRPSR